MPEEQTTTSSTTTTTQATATAAMKAALAALVPPHGGKGLTCALVSSAAEAAELRVRFAAAEAAATQKKRRRQRISTREAGDLVMMGIGGFSPLTRFMGRTEVQSVCEQMRLRDGTFWPIPITLSVDGAVARTLRRGDELALTRPTTTTTTAAAGGSKEGEDDKDEVVGTVAVDDVWETTTAERTQECIAVFGTADAAGHPGVAGVMGQRRWNVGGEVRVLSEGGFPQRFPRVYMRPAETRAAFAQRGWRTVAALQLRNPMHRAHEHLAKVAAEVCDGVFIHSLVGEVKAGDVPAAVRVRCIDAHVAGYFNPRTVLHGGYPLDMRYAGPREALLHALFRQNYGCTHLIVGRDHAGVGNYYGVYDAQRIFDTVAETMPADPAKALLCKPLKLDWSFFCKKCDGPASLRTCPHDAPGDRVVVSGTMVRKLLSEDKQLPEHFGRPEVIAILRDYYRGISARDRVEIKLNRVSTMAPQ